VESLRDAFLNRLLPLADKSPLGLAASVEITMTFAILDLGFLGLRLLCCPGESGLVAMTSFIRFLGKLGMTWGTLGMTRGAGGSAGELMVV
jgi:apolipoprotein N-acyltransferase